MMTTSQRATKQPFVFNEAMGWELIDGETVRVTVMVLGKGDSRFGLYELTVESSLTAGVIDVDALHGFDDDEKPMGLTLAESSQVERWALYSGQVQAVCDAYWRQREDERLESNADEAGWLS